MKTIVTCISEGYIPLIKTFCEANELDIEIGTIKTNQFSYGSVPKITLAYDEFSDSADTLAFLALKHCSVENMLCDYLKRCGISENTFNFGKVPIRSATDKDYEEYKKSLGVEKGWTRVMY